MCQSAPLEMPFRLLCLKIPTCLISDVSSGQSTVPYPAYIVLLLSIAPACLIISSLLCVLFWTQRGLPVHKPNFYSKITRRQLEKIFSSETHVQIPLFEKRIEILHETASILQEVPNPCACVCVCV